MKIFVTGLSRSGKTTLCTYATDKISGLQYVSVSRLLKEAGGVVPVSTLEEGLVNQRLAAQALLSHPEMDQHQIIDGHALVETPEGPLLVPDRFYDELAPNLLIHVCDRPGEILARRQPNQQGSETQIEILTKLAQAACERVADRLGIRLVTLEAPTLDEFAKKVGHLLEGDRFSA